MGKVEDQHPLPLKRAEQLFARAINFFRGWRFAGAIGDGHADKRWPVDFWAHEWQDGGGKVALLDPQDAHKRLMSRRFVEVDGTRHHFVADEVSPGVFVFFLPR